MSKDAQTAGRGLIAIAGAKVWFIVSAYAIQLALPRFWSKEEYGFYSSAMAAISIVTNVLIAATIQSTSKFVSEDEALAGVRLRQGLRIQVVLGLVLSALALIAAPWIAAFFDDPKMTPIFQIGAVVFFAYAFYAVLVGSLNGRRLFSHQARLDTLFALLRTTAIIGAAALGFGVMGSVTGFAAAAGTILVIATLFVGIGERSPKVPVREWLSFMVPIWLYQSFLNGMMQVDLLVMKDTLTEFATTSGLAREAAVAFANDHAGTYRAAQVFAFVPYQLMISMTFVVFPMISRATSSQDEATARATLQGAMRFTLMALLLIAAPIAGAANGIMALAYPDEYMTGGAALSVLSFGMAAFSVFVVGATILNGAGHPYRSAIIGAIGLTSIIILNYTGLHLFPDHFLLAAATATTIGMVIAVVLTAGSVYLRFRAFVSLPTLIRVSVAGVVAFATSRFFPHQGKVMALLALILGFAAGLLTLIATREVSGSDLGAIKRIVKR